MKTTRCGLKIGDTVTGNYYGVAFSGVIVSHDGYDHADIALAAPIVYLGRERTEVSYESDSQVRDSLVLVSRPATVPALRDLPYGGKALASHPRAASLLG